MSVLLALASFSLAAGLLVLLPGPDTLIVVRSILRGGRRSAVATVLGVQTGLVIWVGAAALGLAALIHASTVGYAVLRVVGACYLVWLGVQSLRGTKSPAAVEAAPGLLGTGYRAGLVTNLLNPKVGVFFVTFLPGFVPSGYPIAGTSLLFGAVFIVLNLLYQLPLVLLADRVTRWIGRSRVRRRMEIATGAVLLGFGARLALDG